MISSKVALVSLFEAVFFAFLGQYDGGTWMGMRILSPFERVQTQVTKALIDNCTGSCMRSSSVVNFL